ncbi:hypothetical protein [Staphylococcus cohnii]|uniref:hypothetical protein n=1 Tax=Staphylococcus cohnii TaxID=29382 RepID=UPI003CE944C7
MSTGNGNIKNFRKDVPFEQIPRELLQACDTNSKHNKGLSLQAIGLLCNLRSYAESWDLHKTELYKRYAKNKEASVKRAWDELVENEYIVQLKIREGNKNKYIYYVTVYPFTKEDIKEIEKNEGAKAVKTFTNPRKSLSEQEDLSLRFSRPQNQDLKTKTSKPRTNIKQMKDITNEDITNIREDNNEMHEVNGDNAANHSNNANHSDTNMVSIDFKEYMRLREAERMNNNSDDIKLVILEQFPEDLRNYMSNFDLEEIKLLKEYILIGKSSYNKNVDVNKRLLLEDVEFELILMLKRIKRKIYEKQETIKELNRYITRSTVNVFSRYASDYFEDDIDMSHVDIDSLPLKQLWDGQKGE